MDAIVIAGGVPAPDHSLYRYSQGRPKAMIDINGRPMIEHVIRGLQKAESISHVIVVGLDDHDSQEQLDLHAPVTFLPNQGSLVANGVAGLRWVRDNRPGSSSRPVIGCSSDIPHLTGPMIDDLVARCRPFDRLMYYTIVTPDQMDGRYPGANRTYTKLRDGAFAGGDVFVARLDILESSHDLWEKLTQARKRPLAVARVVGFGTLLKLLTRRLTLDEAAAIGGRALGSDRPLGVVVTPYAELAMDGDRPHQIDLLRKRFS